MSKAQRPTFNKHSKQTPAEKQPRKQQALRASAPSPTSVSRQVKRTVASRKATSTKSKPDYRKASAKRTKSSTAPQTKAKIFKNSRAKAKQRVPRSEAQYLAKPETFKDTWERVIEAISKMRNGKVSLTQAAREARVSPRTVTKYGKSALRKGKSGKYVVKKNDTLLRVLSIPTTEGPRTIAVRGSKQASLLGEYWNAVHRYLQTGDTSRLKAFHGQKITDASGEEIPLLVDPSALNRLGSAGVLSFESIYARTT
jgi:hypothetical protein